MHSSRSREYMTLPDHWHWCLQCHGRTLHHVFDHEDEGDRVEAWCEHCDEDHTHVIGEFYA